MFHELPQWLLELYYTEHFQVCYKSLIVRLVIDYIPIVKRWGLMNEALDIFSLIWWGKFNFSSKYRGGGSILTLKGPHYGFKLSLVSRLGLRGQKILKISNPGKRTHLSNFVMFLTQKIVNLKLFSLFFTFQVLKILEIIKMK